MNTLSSAECELIEQSGIVFNMKSIFSSIVQVLQMSSCNLGIFLTKLWLNKNLLPCLFHAGFFFSVFVLPSATIFLWSALQWSPPD